MTRNANHIIQSGPWAGKTIGEKRRIKRFALSNVAQTIEGSISVLPRAAIRQVEQLPGGQAPRTQRRRRLNNRSGVQFPSRGLGNMSDMQYSLPTPLKPKVASAFYNEIPGLTKAGREYLLALTHPNNEELRSFSGIPDLMADELNAYTAVDDSQTITWDPSMFSTTPPSTVTTYGVYMLFPPFPEVECLYVLFYNNGGAVIFSNARVIRKPGFQTSRNGNGGQLFPTFKDIGYDNFRIGGSGRTLIPICSTLNDQGNVVAGQLPERITWSDAGGVFSQKNNVADTFLSEGTLEPTGDTQVFKVGVLEVPDIVSLTQMDKKCMDGQFRDGAYLTMVPSEPVDVLQKKSSYFSGDSSSGLLKSTDASVAPGVLSFPNSSFSLIIAGNLIPFTADSAYNTSNPLRFTPTLIDIQDFHPCVSEPGDMLTGFAIFSALSIQQPSSNVSTAAIKIRMTENLELFPGADSSNVSVYRAPHPLHDRKALNLAADIAQIMPHALPASDNAFNGILGKIWDVVYKVLKPASSFVKYLPLPGSAIAGDLIGGGLDAIEGIANASTI